MSFFYFEQSSGDCASRLPHLLVGMDKIFVLEKTLVLEKASAMEKTAVLEKTLLVAFGRGSLHSGWNVPPLKID